MTGTSAIGTTEGARPRGHVAALAVVLIVAMIMPAAATWCWFVQFAGHPVARVVYGAAKVIQFLIPIGWMVLGERRALARPRASNAAAKPSGARPSADPVRPSSPHGFSQANPGDRAAPLSPAAGILLGLAFGALVGGTVLALYFCLLKTSPLLAGTGFAVRTKLEQVGLATVPGYVALALFYSLAHSFLEEYYWRWFVFGRLRQFVRFPTAIALSSLAFMAHHVFVVGVYLPRAWGLAAAVSLCVAIGGAAWAWIYARTGSLYGPWASHLLVDAAIMAVGYDMIWGISG